MAVVPYRWCVGVVYPRDSVMPHSHPVDGYVLTQSEMAIIADGLRGKPVTFEHTGIARAVKDMSAAGRYSSMDVIRSLNTVSHGNAAASPVGIVTDVWRCADGAWRCAFRINEQLFPRTCAMIDANSLGALSISHLHTLPPTALEVSLCHKPARPQCFVEQSFRALDGCQKYKAFTSQHANTDMEVTVATPAAPSMAEALASMTAEHRLLVSAAFNDMQSTVERLGIDGKKNQERVQELERASVVDKQMLKSQIETFLGQIDANTLKQYGMEDTARVTDNMCGEDPAHIRRTVDRLLMCCNQHMFRERMASDRAPETKRKAVAPPQPLFDPVAETSSTPRSHAPTAAAANSPADLLRRALYEFNDA